MKKTAFAFLLSLSCCWLAAQCPTGDITFSTQGQIDSFQINYPGCKSLPGVVRVAGNDITNLQGLSTLDSVYKSFLIWYNPLLTSLHGLENLSYVGNSPVQLLGSWYHYGLAIGNNTLLVSTSGLDNLKSALIVSIFSNPSLTDLTGLAGLTDVGHFDISGNKNLKTLGGLSNLDSLETLDISGNESLVSLSGLENLRSLGAFYVGYNPSLTNFKGLDQLQSVGSLHVEFNDVLQNFEGLEKLNSISCFNSNIQVGFVSFHVESNPSLVEFKGLENLQSIRCETTSPMKILNNESLKSLAGIGGMIDSTIELTIHFNPTLTTCNVPPLCKYLEKGNAALISDNAPGCNSAPEIQAACAVPTREVVSGQIACSPNPAADFLKIELPENTATGPLTVQVFDAVGKLVLEKRPAAVGQTLDLQGLPPGVFALKVMAGERAYAGRFVKQ